ncbi:MAG: hypothetical protein ACJZ8F_05695 [Candidatus Pelagibacter sp.]
MKNKNFGKLLNINLKNFELEKIIKKELNKYIIIIKSRNQGFKYINKIHLSKFSIKLGHNEKKGYIFFKKKKINKIRIPKYKTIVSLSKKYVSKIDYIKGIDVNYLDIEALKYLLKYSVKTKKKICIKQYLNIINDNFKSIYSFDISKELIIDWSRIIRKFKQDIFISSSHGDFTHKNLIKQKNNYFLIDFEFFSKRRTYLFDSIHWLIPPLLKRTSNFLMRNINFSFLFIFYLKMFYRLIGYDINENEVKVNLILYFLEQKFFYKLPNILTKEKKLLSQKRIKESKHLSRIYSRQLNYLLK